MIACCVTTDTVLLAVVGRAAVGPSAIGPVSDGVGFVTFFYAGPYHDRDELRVNISPCRG